MKAIHYISILLAAPLFFSCTTKEPAKKLTDKDTIPVRIIPLDQQTGNAAIALSGQFTTDDEVLLSFKTGGIINRVLVKEGDPVKKGQLLATLNLTEINAQVQQAQLALEKAARDHKRTQSLYADSVATLEQLQNTKTALQLARQQLNLVSFNRKFSEIHAPQDGFILKKLADAGQQVSSGTAVLQSNGEGKWMLKAAVSDQEWVLLKLNDKAKVQIASLPGQSFEGIVSRKSEGADAATGTFAVYITLTGKRPEGIATGMFGKAVVNPSGQTSGSWKIPYEALLDGNGSSGYVFITNDHKRAQKKMVTIASIEKNTVTITNGLQGATSLIVSGSAYLTDNSKISIHSPLNTAK
ncbi:MAG TPA: efflux RND transporter periplasmic adaptor subunit [Pedobacter sp.]|uniref:efflux RND transporter periplasmic adaptor subunit n=1 Tax=Pedobacter sp. TaxID=1411316 RepID=UPI002CA1DE1B|nr:efflux RND transporter periplasmic adaptor subunit [Pedobacter sp.]HMI01453.1 efflux RND transporter periplasmic adaptor subunit [Pedobacter sp.]